MDNYHIKKLATVALKSVFVFLAGIVFSLPYTALSMVSAVRHFTKFVKYFHLVGDDALASMDRFLAATNEKYNQLVALVLSDEDQNYQPLFQLGIGVGVLGILAGSAFVGFAPFVMAGHVPQIVTAVAAAGELGYSFLTFVHCYVALKGLQNVKEGLSSIMRLQSDKKKPEIVNESDSTLSQEIQRQQANQRSSIQCVKQGKGQKKKDDKTKDASPIGKPDEKNQEKFEKVIVEFKKKLKEAGENTTVVFLAWEHAAIASIVLKSNMNFLAR